MEYFGARHITLKVILAFMQFFSNITIQKYDETGNLSKIIRVPLNFGSREKYLNIIKNHGLATDLNEQDHVEVDLLLPKIIVNITGLTYDSTRHLNTINKIYAEEFDTTEGAQKRIYMPAPYNLELEMTILSKTVFDAMQIIEQIIPWFTPSFSIDIKTLGDEFESESIPIILNSVSPDIPTELDLLEDRLITFTLNFTIKMNYYLPERLESLIQHIQTNLYHKDTLKKITQIDITYQNNEIEIPPQQDKIQIEQQDF